MSTGTRFSFQELLFALLRVTLGCIFIYASIDKITDPQAFAASIGNYKIVAGSARLLVATVLPWVELFSGVGLLLGIFEHGSALLTMSMLAIFTVLVLSAMMRGLDISCGCFTQDPAAGKVGWTKIMENLILITVNFFVFRASTGRFSLARFLQSK